METPSLFRSFVNVAPNTLNSLSHEAEFAETDRRRLADKIRGGLGFSWKDECLKYVHGFWNHVLHVIVVRYDQHQFSIQYIFCTIPFVRLYFFPHCR